MTLAAHHASPPAAADHRGPLHWRQIVDWLRADGVIRIHDCANVATSFPNFLALCQQVGMRVAQEGKA